MVFFINANFIMQMNKKFTYLCKKNCKGESKIDENKIELALEVINIKISEIMKKEKVKNYGELREILEKLTDKKRRIYEKDERVINEILSEYLNDIKNNSWGK